MVRELFIERYLSDDLQKSSRDISNQIAKNDCFVNSPCLIVKSLTRICCFCLTRIMFVLIDEKTIFLSKNFASLIKTQSSTLVKLVKLRQSDSLYVSNLFHEHVSQ